MSDENTQSTPEAAPAVSASKSIGLKVAEQIANAGPAILDKVINNLASLEIEKRANALLNGVNLAVATKRELQKIKPDVVAYDASGAEVSANWSKSKLEEKKKLEEKLGKIEKAVELAVTKNDFSKVSELKAE
jgi:hypothetical protein